MTTIEKPSGAVTWYTCTLRAELPAGDHTIALLEICAVGADPETPPLVFHGSRFRRLAVTVASEERG